MATTTAIASSSHLNSSAFNYYWVKLYKLIRPVIGTIKDIDVVEKDEKYKISMYF